MCMSKVVFFSGAGLSADSGLGTFRGSGGGLWDKYDINKVCNYNTWQSNYDLVHEFYNLRRVEYAKAEPNNAHKIIAKLQSEFGTDKVIAITQNIDDLLERAGCKNVMHVHGEINYVYCTTCNDKLRTDGMFDVDVCAKCGSTNKFKPYVVFFGEQAPMYTPMYQTIASLGADDAIVVIGTEGSVVPIGQIIGTKSNGIPAKRILCNLEKSPYIDDRHFDIVMYDQAAEVADVVYDEVKKVLSGQ